MKQHLPLFLFLVPCLALAQYPSNGNQKITLGEQTTADGLIYRGVAATDTVRKPSIDTMAYMVLDTTTNIMWHYKKATTNAWLRLNLLPSDTASMLTNYWRAGRFSGVLPIANGGTGSATQNFVDLTNTQTVAGAKTFTSDIKVNDIKIGRGSGNLDNNTAIGFLTFNSNTTGNNNFALGKETLYKNTTGSNNVAIGNVTAFENTTGEANTYIGYQAGRYNVSSSNNIGIGYLSLHKNTGSGNLGLGSNTGYAIESGENNVCIGREAGYNFNSAGKIINGSNNIHIGYQAVNNGGDSSNIIVLGNSSISKIKCQVTSITGLSDARDKTNIIPVNYGIDFILKLKPVTFNWNIRDAGKIGNEDIGFIAQDLIKAQAEQGIIVPNLTSGNEERYEATPGVLIPIIVKALQQQNEMIKLLQDKILKLENK
jgi:hypothetical protein